MNNASAVSAWPIDTSSTSGIVTSSGEPLDASDLDARCRAVLADYKVPRQWEFVDELPRNPTGKVLKHELRRRFRSEPA